MFNNG
jgi:hypothetical protein